MLENLGGKVLDYLNLSAIYLQVYVVENIPIIELKVTFNDNTVKSR